MKDDELDLWRRCQEGDKEALEELLLSPRNMRLVRFWVNHVASVATWADRDDLKQEGLIGLVKAIQKFDPDRGSEFSTCAGYYIREALYDYVQQSRSLTRHMYENFKRVNKVQEDLMQSLGRKPTEAEIAHNVGLTLQQVERALDAMRIAFPEALMAFNHDPPTSTVTVESPESVILIGELILKLNERERWVLTEYYYWGRTDSEIAELLGLTTDYAKKFRRHALKRLRKLLEAKHGGEHNEG